MPLLVEKRIFALLAMHLSTHINLLNVRGFVPPRNTGRTLSFFPASCYQAADVAIGAEVLALICSTEDFDSHDDYYVDSPEAESALISFYGESPLQSLLTDLFTHCFLLRQTTTWKRPPKTWTPASGCVRCWTRFDSSTTAASSAGHPNNNSAAF
jgi:hypothetical protein